MILPVVRFAPTDEMLPADPDLLPVGRLSAAEQARHLRLRSTASRRAYVAAHVLVRDVLAELAGESLEIAQRCADCGKGDHGTPYVVGRPDLFVSLSHSVAGEASWVAAMAALVPCGVDVQVVSRVPDRALTTRELAAVGEDERARNRLWARKEALIKAGVATLGDLDVLDVLEPRTGLENWDGPDPHVVGAWAVRDR